MSPIRGYRSLDRGAKRIVMVGAIAIFALTLAAAMGIALAIIAREDAQASCGFYRDAGNIPPAASTNAVGLRILADARNSFVKAGCSGTLSPADIREYPYLRGDAH